MLAPSLQQFSLRVEMLPSYIPVRVAEKILFVGESVQMFENHNQSPSRAGGSLLFGTENVCGGFFLSNIALVWLFRIYTETSGGHVCCRAQQTQTAASLQSGGL